MTPGKDFQQRDDESVDDSSKDSQDGSQSLDMNKIQELMACHKTTVCARRRNVEKQLHESHKQSFEALKHRQGVHQADYERDLYATSLPCIPVFFGTHTY